MKEAVALAGTPHEQTLTHIRDRLEAEKAKKIAAEQDVRSASNRYARAETNVKALERLLSLFETYANNGDWDHLPF